VQVDPIKPTLKAPGIKLVKLKHDKPLSNIAFKFNLHRYTKVYIWEVPDDFVDVEMRVLAVFDGVAGHLKPKNRTEFFAVEEGNEGIIAAADAAADAARVAEGLHTKRCVTIFATEAAAELAAAAAAERAPGSKVLKFKQGSLKLFYIIELQQTVLAHEA
jgi:hypothetical protein